MRVVFARHATTDWNVAGRIQGHTDIPLNARGREGAASLADLVRPHHVARIVSSDLIRARETATIIAAAIDVPCVTDARLRECGFGELEGLTVAAANARYPEARLAEAGKSADDLRAYDFRPWGGEDADAVAARHQNLLDALCIECGDRAVCLVGHGRGLGTILARHWSHLPIRQGTILALEYP